MVQREVAERIAAPPGGDELPVGVRAVPRPRADRASSSRPDAFEPAPEVGSAVIVVEPFDADDRLAPDDGGRAVAAGPGRLPRAPQDAPQRARRASCRVDAEQRRRGARRRPASPPTGARRRSRWGSGWRCARRSGRSGRTGAAAARPAAVMTAGPVRRLTPVVRLAPAKLNLTLAVVGRRADGYHDLHSVMVPLDLADRLSLAPGRRSRRQPARGRVRRRARSPTTSCSRAGRDACGRRWRLDRGADRRPAGAGARGPPREADPGGRRARRRQQRRRGRHRRRARGVGRRARCRRAPRGWRLDLGSDVPFFLAGGAGPGRGPRRAGRAAAAALARRAGRAARDAGRPASRRRTSSRPSRRPRRVGDRRGPACVGAPGRGARARAARAPTCSPGPACSPRPTTCCRRAARRCRSSCRSGGRSSRPRPAGRPVRLRPDPLGALSFAGRGGRRGRSVRAASARWRRWSPRAARRRSWPPRSIVTHATTQRSDDMTRQRDLDHRRAGRHRPVQPGASAPAGSSSAAGQVGARPRDRRARRGRHRGPDGARPGATSRPCSTPPALRFGRRRQDDMLPRRHRRLRGLQRRLRPVLRRTRRRRARRSRWRRCPRARASRSRRSRRPERSCVG